MRDAAWHIKFGQHSKIPQCCINFWIENVFPSHHYPYSLHYNLAKETEKKYNIRWGYVPCWDCLDKRKMVEIHHCTNECSNFLSSNLSTGGTEIVKIIKNRSSIKKVQTKKY